MSTKMIGLVLAAGKGTRLKINIPKPLIPLRGKPLGYYPINAINQFYSEKNLGENPIVVVTGHGKDQVEEALSNEFKNLHYVFQKEQNGTGHAVKIFLDSFKDVEKYEYVVIMCADTPCITQDHVTRIYDYALETKSDAVAATVLLDDPTGYGRIIRNSENKGLRIVEHKDANDEQRQVKEINSAFYIIKTNYLLEKISTLTNDNASGELYLTDIFEDGSNTHALCFERPELFSGINDLYQLEQMRKLQNRETCIRLMKSGVIIHDSENTYIEDSVKIQPSAEIQPMVRLEGDTTVEAGSFIGQGSILKNCQVKEGAKLHAYSHLSDAVVGSSTQVGPFARLRDGVTLGENCRIGNFVEIKKSEMKSGSKSAHLSYIGDAQIGERSNLGCGFITCNYDGAQKHKTIIGKDTFVGSDSQMIAPITLGDNVYVASGSTINQNLADGDFAIARTRQVTKPGMARRFLKKKS